MHEQLPHQDNLNVESDARQRYRNLAHAPVCGISISSGTLARSVSHEGQVHRSAAFFARGFVDRMVPKLARTIFGIGSRWRWNCQAPSASFTSKELAGLSGALPELATRTVLWTPVLLTNMCRLCIRCRNSRRSICRSATPLSETSWVRTSFGRLPLSAPNAFCGAALWAHANLFRTGRPQVRNCAENSEVPAVLLFM